MSNAVSRKDLRALLLPFEAKSNPLAIAILLADVLLLVFGTALATLLPLTFKVVGSFLIWLAIARLFIVGHDACHGSYTSSRQMNKVIGRIAFLPSLTPFFAWGVGHNIAHHGFTNLVGKDYVWVPLSLAEYECLSPWQRLHYRIQRSIVGAGYYYLTELWWKRLFFPSRSNLGGTRFDRIADSLLVTVFLAVWLFGLVALADLTQQSPLTIWLFGFLFPFVAWNYLMGFVIYVHHTHPDVSWYREGASWAASQPYLSATVHIQFPGLASAALHHIMEHPAHHLDMGIPLYRLREAQRVLERSVGSLVVTQEFSWEWYTKVVHSCKLYDFAGRRWLPFPR